jgi:hypothetical protein
MALKESHCDPDLRAKVFRMANNLSLDFFRFCINQLSEFAELNLNPAHLNIAEVG